MIMSKPIGIEIANIYINFSEIMKEEYKDLWEFINDEHIVAKDVTNEIIELKNINDKLSSALNSAEQRIDNAIWLLDLFISDTDLSRYDILKILMDVKKKLKGKDVK